MGHEVEVVSQFRSPAAYNPYNDGPPRACHGITPFGLEQVGEQRDGDFEADISKIVEKIIELHERAPFDVVHAQFAYPTGYAALQAARMLDLPVVVSIQGGDGHWFGTCCDYHKRVMRTILRESDALIIGSESFAEEVRGNIGEAALFDIIPGATDTDLFRPPSQAEKSELQSRFSVPDDRVIVLYHGRLDRRKGVGVLLESFRNLATITGNSAIHLVISGAGPDRKMVEDMIKDPALLGRVTDVGPIDYESCPDIYKAADIFCTPTFAEGFSNTIVEAMATGLPVITTLAIGVKDVFTPDEDALMVPIEDASSLSDAIIRLAADAKLRRRLGAHGRSLVEERWGWTSIAPRICDVYERVRSQKKSRSELPVISVPQERDTCRFRVSPHLL
jgi:glycosyltransferase involved in cell wall biosynthesis